MDTGKLTADCFVMRHRSLRWRSLNNLSPSLSLRARLLFANKYFLLTYLIAQVRDGHVAVVDAALVDVSLLSVDGADHVGLDVIDSDDVIATT